MIGDWSTLSRKDFSGSKAFEAYKSFHKKVRPEELEAFVSEVVPIIYGVSRTVFPGVSEFDREDLVSVALRYVINHARKHKFPTEDCGYFVSYLKKLAKRKIISAFQSGIAQGEMVPGSVYYERSRYIQSKSLPVPILVDISMFLSNLEDTVTEWVISKNRFPNDLSEAIVKYIVRSLLKGEMVSPAVLKTFQPKSSQAPAYWIKYVRALCVWCLYELREKLTGPGVEERRIRKMIGNASKV